METKNNHEIPIIGERTRKLWSFSAIMWTIIYYSVNILAFASSILVILIECFSINNDLWIVLLTFLSIVFAFVGVLINFRQQFTRYRRAFNILNFAMLDYYAHPNDDKIDAIVQAIAKGENIIDNSYDVENNDKER